MNEIVRAINFSGLERLSLQQMMELKLFDIISLRNYLIKREYEKLLEEGEKSRDAMRILANTTWVVEEGRSIKLGIKSIERIIYRMKE
ncbi:MAG: hypothetical protein P4L45_05905 [Ignavibacteriaceae bacterium]|nr:hypothetical protein [Ignavibacteriaceae bacterium]